VLIFVVAFILCQVVLKMTHLSLVMWVDRINEGQSQSSLNNYILYYFIFTILFVFMNLLCSMFNSLFFLSAVRNLHHTMLANLIYAPVNTFFDVVPSGRILNRFSKDIEETDGELNRNVNGFLSSLFAALGTLIFCAYLIPYSIIGIFLLFLGTYLLQRFCITSSRELARLSKF
jgi:ATP-binding cassette, subfamily C (CFTR/MRP), member 1